MATKIIPLQPNNPAYTFVIVLNDVTYNISIRWNTRAQFYTLDLADQDGNMIQADIALKAGLDLLEPFALGIGSLFVVDMTNRGLEATPITVGSDVLLVYKEPVE